MNAVASYPPSMKRAICALIAYQECKAAFVHAYGSERAEHELPSSHTGRSAIHNAQWARTELAKLLQFARDNGLDWLGACRGARA